MSMLAVDDLAELLQGMGQASPGPLFLIDEVGSTHALNGLAERMDEGASSERAFVSPVHLGAGRQGRVVGYVPPTADRREEGLLSALVALVAGALSDRFAGQTGPLARFSAFPGDPSTTLDRACSELGTVCDEQRVGDIVLDAATCVLRGRRATLHVRRSDAEGLTLLASLGVESEQAGPPARLGHGLVGWAADLSSPRLVCSVDDLPADAPASAWSELERGLPFPPPIALVPLRCGPELAGVLCVGGLPSAASDPELSGRALLRLERLLDKAAANLAGLRILRQVRREERVRREIDIARQIQAGLLPEGELVAGDLHLAGDCRPAALVGGDWFGHEVDPLGRLTLTVFDVAGHGIGAAVGMTMVRSVLQAALARGGHPADAVSAANLRVSPDLEGSGLYATAFVARIDPESDMMDYASAGHAPPVHWSASERCFVERPEGGLPLGFTEGGDCPPASGHFGAGDLLVAFTDGITEARNPQGESYGRARLVAAIRRLRRRSATAVHRGLRRELETFTQGRRPDDDATLVVIKRRPAPRLPPRAEEECCDSVSEANTTRG